MLPVHTNTEKLLLVSLLYTVDPNDAKIGSHCGKSEGSV